MYKPPLQFRFTNQMLKELMGEPDDYCGAFRIPLTEMGKKNSEAFFCIASNGEGWEHVSVHISNPKANTMRTPTWEEMCFIKGIFWGAEDVVIQYHPAEKDYVNNHPHCLHLWRPINIKLPTPPPEMVGFKSE